MAAPQLVMYEEEFKRISAVIDRLVREANAKAIFLLDKNGQLIANAGAMGNAWKRTKIENLALLLSAAIEAQGRVGLMLNVRRDDLPSVLGLLPSLRHPTVSTLSDESWVAVNTIIEERTARDLIPRLKAARAQGIVEYPLNKIVL